MARRIAQYQICTLLTVIDLASYTFMKLRQLPALSHNFLTKQIGGGVLTPKKKKKKKKDKKNKKTKPIHQFTNFDVPTVFFLGFLVFFGSFLVLFWDDILTLKSHATKTKPKPKKPKNPKIQFPILEFRILAKNNSKRPKKQKIRSPIWKF